MNVTKIKGLAWLVAAGLTGGLFYYVFTSFTELKNRPRPFQEGSPDYQLADEILHKTYEADGPKVDVVPLADVQRAFNDLNWTGKPAPKPVVVEKPPENATVPKTPVASLIKVLYIRQDDVRPENSEAFIVYLEAAKVTSAPKTGVSLGVGDSLAEPHSYATVAAIDAREGVTFHFAEEGREPETVAQPTLDVLGEIAQAGPGGPILPARTPVQTLRGSRPATRQTTMIGRNHYALGTEDMFLLADDYPTIIAREVRHRRHRDPKTGKYDGIELTSVQPGGTVARHGGDSGDVIKSINGTPVTSVQEAVTYVNNNRENYTTWEVVVENRGQVRTVTYESPPTSQP